MTSSAACSKQKIAYFLKPGILRARQHFVKNIHPVIGIDTGRGFFVRPRLRTVFDEEPKMRAALLVVQRVPTSAPSEKVCLSR